MCAVAGGPADAAREGMRIVLAAACLVLVADQTPRVRVTSVPVLVVDGNEPADTLGERIRDFLTRGPAATA